MEFTARRVVGNAERIADGFKNSTALFARSISIGSKLVDSVNVAVGFVVGVGEKSNNAFNQQEAFAVGVPFGRTQNVVGEIVQEKVVGVVSFGAVDDDGLKLFIPTLRHTKELTQVVFAFNGVVSEAFDKSVGDVVEDLSRVAMAKIIVEGSPNVVTH